MLTSLNLFLSKLLTIAAKRRAGAIHLTAGAYPTLRVDEELIELTDEQMVTKDVITDLATGMLDQSEQESLAADRELQTVIQLADRFRVKVSFFYQRGILSAELRLIPDQPPALINLGLPKSVYELSGRKSGLLVISGPYGSGRSTTMAAMLDEINKNRRESIVVIEKPIEHLFTNKQSIIEQRQVGHDVKSFADAIRLALQSDVDIIAVGINSEREAIPLLLEFASSGRLVLLQKSATTAVQAIDELLAAFPSADREHGQSQLASALLAIVVQRLVPRMGGGQVLAAEVLIANEAIRSLIQQDRITQLHTILQSSRAEGMVSLDQSLAALVRSGEVLVDEAAAAANNPENFRLLARRSG